MTGAAHARTAGGGGEPSEAPPNLLDLMNRLAEPEAPLPVPFAPQTWGWVVLAALLALGIAWLARREIQRRRANAYRRAALAELAAANDDPVAIAAVLRRAALAAWPREAVASLTGEDWLRFLRETGGAAAFSGAAGEALRVAPWRPDPPPSPELRLEAERWVRGHRAPEAARAKRTAPGGADEAAA